MAQNFVLAVRKWLEERIRSGRPGERLPTIEEVARRHGVSGITVRRLYRRMADLGAIRVRQGHGSFIAGEKGGQEREVPLSEIGSAVTQAALNAPTTSAERLEAFLTDGMLRGVYRTGQALPSIKYMARQFHVAPATVSRACHSLIRKGTVTRVGRWLRVGDPVGILRSERGRPICLFTNSSMDFSGVYHDRDSFVGPWMSQVYRIVEMELQLRGFGMRYHRLEELPALAEAWRRQGNPPQALCMHALAPLEHPDVLPRLARIQRDAPEGLRPVVLVDWTTGDFASVPRSLRAFSRGGILTSLARSLARCALERGYRKVLFFADPDLASLKLYVRLWNELRRLDSGIEFEVAALAPGGDTDRRAFMQKVYAHFAPEVLRAKLSKYVPTAPDELEARVRLVSDFGEPFRRREARFLGIFLRDADAASALSLARSGGLAPPQAMGIIGLENNPGFLHAGITCWIPDWYAIGNLLAGILAGEQPGAFSRLGFIRTPTLFLDRGTA